MLSKLISSSSKIISFGKSQGKQLYSSAGKRIYEPIFFSTQNQNIANFSTLTNKKARKFKSSIGAKNKNFSTTTKEPSTATIDLGTRNKWWNQKPFEQGTKDEVQMFFRTFKDGKYKEHASKFVELDGEDLIKMTKEDFIRRSPEIGDLVGDVLFYNIQELNTLSYERILNILAEKLDPTPTEVLMPLVEGNRKPDLFFLFTAFVSNFISHQRNSDNKKEWRQGWIYGQRGIGKTRLSREFLNIFKVYLKDEKTFLQAYMREKSSYSSAKALEYRESLLKAMEHPSTLIIDICNNGCAIEDWESSLHPSSFLGMRVFFAFCFPSSKIKRFKDALLAMTKGDWAKFDRLFHLHAVLNAIAKGVLKPFGQSSSVVPTMMHITIDEFQVALDTMHKYEKFATFLSGALMAACINAPRDLPVFGSLASILYGAEVIVGPTFIETPVELPLFDAESSLELVNLSVPVQRRPSLIVWKRLLQVCGGNARVLEQLVKICLQHHDPTKLSFRQAFQLLATKTASVIAEKSNWENENELVLHLSFAGIPLSERTQFGQSSLQGKKDIGIINLVPTMTSNEWVDRNSQFQVQLPFVVAAAGPIKDAFLESCIDVWVPESPAVEMEKFFFHHIVWRVMLSSKLVKGKYLNRSHTLLRASDLFYGALSSQIFQERLFVPSPEFVVYTAVDEVQKDGKYLVNVQSSPNVDLAYEQSNYAFAIKFVGKSDFDGVISMKYIPNKAEPTVYKPIMIWIEGINSDQSVKVDDTISVSKTNTEKRLERMQKMKDTFPKHDHLFIICSNSPRSDSGAIEILKNSDDIAIIDDSIVRSQHRDHNAKRLDLVLGPNLAPLVRMYRKQLEEDIN